MPWRLAFKFFFFIFYFFKILKLGLKIYLTNLQYHFLNFDNNQIIKSKNTTDKTRTKIKCFKIIVSNNINEKQIIIKQ